MLWKVLGYRSPGAFNQAAHRGHVPVPLVKLPFRRGRYALRREVNAWLRQVTSMSDAMGSVRATAPPASGKGAAQLSVQPIRSSTAAAMGSLAFGAAIRDRRLRAGLMQKQVALTAGIDQSALAGIEGGRRPPPKLRQLQRLLQALAPSDEERQQILQAWDVSRMARAMVNHDDESRDVILRVAAWLAAVSRDERIAAQRLAVASVPFRPARKEAPMT